MSLQVAPSTRRQLVWLFGTALLCLAPELRAQTRPLLGAVTFEVVDVADSGTYYIYWYRILNPRTSRAGVEGVMLDVTAPGAGRQRLAFTGHLEKGAGEGEHGPIGGIAPDRWEMFTTYHGTLDWYSEEALARLSDTAAIPASTDSAAPGGSKDGFGIRSPYLLAVRSFRAIPTYQACCSVPNQDGEYPTPFLVPVSGQSVAPAVNPATMTADLFTAQVREVCNRLHWVDGDLCITLDQTLRGAGNDRRAAIQGIVDLLDKAWRAKTIDGNAYWMLSTSGRHLLAHL